MDVAPPTTKDAPPSRVAAPWAWLGVVAAPFIAVGMSALASIPIAILAVPVAYILTHDGYVALLSVSYGPFVAAQVMVDIALAAALWSIATLVGDARAWHRGWIAASGALAGALGLWLAPVAQLGALDPAWRYGPTLPITPANVLAVVLAGGLAGVIRLRHQTAPAGAATWRTAFNRVAADVALFALVMALLLEGWAAITSL